MPFLITLVSRFENKRARVYTVSQIGRRRSVVEPMSQMSSAPGAVDSLSRITEFHVGFSTNRVRKCRLIETGPTGLAVILVP